MRYPLTVDVVAPPLESLIDDVHEDRLFNVGRANPGVQSYEQLNSGDPAVRAFAATLDATFEIVDPRNAAVGFGFSWGRYGPRTVVRRAGELPIFAVRKRMGFWERWGGRARERRSVTRATPNALPHGASTLLSPPGSDVARRSAQAARAPSVGLRACEARGWGRAA